MRTIRLFLLDLWEDLLYAILDGGWDGWTKVSVMHEELEVPASLQDIIEAVAVVGAGPLLLRSHEGAVQLCLDFPIEEPIPSEPVPALTWLASGGDPAARSHNDEQIAAL